VARRSPFGMNLQMAAAAESTFSVIQKDGSWFWCSLSLMRENELIGPFPSQEEAEKDAKATLGIKEGQRRPHLRISRHNGSRFLDRRCRGHQTLSSWSALRCRQGPDVMTARQRFKRRLIGLRLYVFRKLSRRGETAAPPVYFAFPIGPEALAVGVCKLDAQKDEDALKRATPLFHEGLNRIEVWCGSRKVGGIPPRQNEVSDRGAIRGCA
jgi:hypothetical protein